MGNEQSGGSGHRADYRRHAPVANRQESQQQQNARIERASQFEDRVKKFAPKDAETIKQEHWKKYASIGKPTEDILVSTAMKPKTGGSGVVGGASLSPSQPQSQSSSLATAGRSLGSVAPTNSAASIDPNRARAARAAAMEAKTSKLKHYKPQQRSDQWETYKQLDALEKSKEAATSVDQSPAISQSPSPSSDNSDAKSNDTKANSNVSDVDELAFQEQMFYLIHLAQAMPAGSRTLLTKIIGNLLKSDPASADGEKFRKIKMNAAKIQSEIVNVDGALDILFACGFQQQDDYLVFPADCQTSVAELAFEKLTIMNGGGEVGPF